MSKTCQIIGAPVQTGTSQPGCVMGPDAYRSAGLVNHLRDLGWDVVDIGAVQGTGGGEIAHPNPTLRDLAAMVSWTDALSRASYSAARNCDLPIFLGGDHSMAAGTVSGVARHAQEQGRPQFVLWLDAHPDLHTLDTTTSGNLHGTPTAYFSGQSGFECFPAPSAPVAGENIFMMGIRSVDPAEQAMINATGIHVHDMRAIDENGIIDPLGQFLKRVKAANGCLHVSFDVDFLDPSIAPAVGTTVPGGATFREAHLIMEMLHDSGLVSSLDLVELNPFLDERGRTAKLMTDLTASLFGRRVLDRMTRSY